MADDPKPREPDMATTIDDDGAHPRTSGFRRAVAAASRDGERYKLGSEIARGGLGKVTSAIDDKLQRQVAIKELHEHTEHGRRRFVREGLTTARLQHPAIVPVLDIGTWESGDPYIVMKLLDGKTLADELAARTTLDARLALLPNLLAVADALGYAHEQGVVHRDVKPSNIMLGTHGETVLLDLGVAHDRTVIEREQDEPELAASAQLTVAGTIAGTLRFMSPEQARGEPAVPGFDVYSLGLTIATVLAGTTPFEDDAPQLVLDRLRAGRSAIPALPAGIAADLLAIVAKATAAPAERYANAGELATDLRKFIAGQLVGARRYTRRQLVVRWMRRHRVLIGAGAAAVVAIAVIATFAVRSVVHERNLAVTEREQAVARERELILLQARASLRIDPTASLAWLAQYPIDAPGQDAVLAILDEADGRGVARHVWHGTGAAAQVVFSPDGRALVSAHRDGELARTDLATGARERLGNAGAPLAYVVAHPRGIFALDVHSGLHRWSAGALTRETIVTPSKVTGMYASGDDLKITFVDIEARYVPATPGAATRAPQLGGEYLYADDENNAIAVYIVRADGELVIADPEPRVLWKFAPDTTIRTSDDGRSWLAFEPQPDGTATLWTGSAGGGQPLDIGKLPACPPGASQDASSDISDAGNLVITDRCGIVYVVDVATRRRIPIANPDRVGAFSVSRDGRWLALGRSGGSTTAGVELFEVPTGLSRLLAGASRIEQAAFSPDGNWLFSSGVEQGLRAWDLRALAVTAGRIADTVTPTGLVAGPAGELSIRHHLSCSIWSTRERRFVATAGIAAADIRNLDDTEMLWAWDGAADGRTCIFAGRDGTATVATAAGTRALRADTPITGCALDPPGHTATCRTEGHAVVAFDARTGAQLSTRKPAADGTAAVTVRATVPYRGGVVVVVGRGTACALETATGEPLAKLPGECPRARPSNGEQIGRESAVIVERARAVDVWTEAGIVTVPSERGIVEVSRERDLVAAARDRAIELWDLRTQTRLADPPVTHALTIELLAWSSTGILASVDREDVRLWDAASGRTRVIHAGGVLSIVWSADGRSLFTTDGRVIHEWPVDMARGASPQEVRARLEQLTSARIVANRAVTP